MESPYKEEMDFRELLRRPQRLFGYSYVYILLVLAAVGVLYAQRLTDIGKASVVPLQLSDTTAQVQDIPLQAPQVIPPVDLAAVAAPTQKLLDRGKELFQANCQSCHGLAGAGDGPSAASMNPKPRNFHSTAGWTYGPKISQMYKTLQEGIVRNGMASYGYIPPVDRFALIHYVRTFVPAPPAETVQDLQSLESAYQLSRGIRVSGSVPVRIAEEKILEETGNARSRAGRMAEILRQQGSDPLIAATICDPQRVSTSMLAPGANTLELPPAEFGALVVHDPAAIGFKPAVARMGASDLAVLQRRLAAAARGVRGE